MAILPGTHAVDVITGDGFTTGVNEGYYTHYSFLNYCPLCGYYDCLERGFKRNDEITCTYCDADYSFSGKEKLHRPRAWLTPYVPEPEPSVLENTTTNTTTLTGWDLAHHTYQNNQDNLYIFFYGDR